MHAQQTTDKQGHAHPRLCLGIVSCSI